MEDLIKKILSDQIKDSLVTVEGGESKYTVQVISDIFKDKTIIDRNKLKDILDDLPPNFVRVHRSYVINKNFIDALNSTTLFISPNIEIPLSRTFKSNIAS